MAIMNFVKILLHVFNAIFIAVGITLVVIGIWTTVDKVYVSLVVGDTLFQAASYLIIAVGVTTVVVCAVGLFAVLQEKQTWLLAYIGLLVLCCCALLTAAILGVVFKTEVQSRLVDNMRDSLINKYGMDNDVTEAWDQLQADLQCCAISETSMGQSVIFDMPYVDDTLPLTDHERELSDSWPIYKRTEFYEKQLGVGINSRKYVPKSCCKYDGKIGDYANLQVCQFFATGPPSNFGNSLKNDYLYYEGCYSKARSLMLKQSDIIVAMGFVFGFIMVAGMVLSFMVIRTLKAEEINSLKERRRPENRDASLDLL